MRRAAATVLVSALLALGAPTSLAGGAPCGGEIAGTITVGEGEPLPGASVELSGPALAKPRSTVTDVSGRYVFRSLTSGLFSVKASFSGFESAVRENVAVECRRSTSVDFSIKLRSVANAVTVTAETPVLDVRQSTLSYSASNQAGTAAADRSRLARPYSGLRVVNGKPYADMYFQSYGVNPTVETAEERFSTFSVSPNTASYSLARSFLERDVLPEPDGVRVEEFVNSFGYQYEPPRNGDAFTVHAEAFPSPSRTGYHVLHLGLKGREVARAARAPAHLVFVVDVSGSMAGENRLGLVKRSLRLLVSQLDERDTVGLVVFGTTARVVLPPVSGAEKARILLAVDALAPEGSTNLQDGVREGYRMAAARFVAGDVNRVVLCTDGVANNGVTDADGIFAAVKDEAARGIALTAVGFGMGNFNDVLLEKLAKQGDGRYAYVDALDAARRLFVEELTGTLQLIAKDVKVEVEFDPQSVARYRLLGYEGRSLSHEEFDDDAVDAGDVGAGHAVTALYEVKLLPGVRPLGSVKIRHKAPGGGASTLLRRFLPRSLVKPSLERASSRARLSLVAAAFAEKLRVSYWARTVSYASLRSLWDGLSEATKADATVAELGTLIASAERLDGRADPYETLVPAKAMDFDRVPILR